MLPEGLPVDDPDLHPIWAAMGDADLPLLHHSFFYEPPYFPGYRDVWGHVALARAAAHPWGAQRLLGYVILSGLLDQFPNLRIGFAECSGGWLPSWLVRLEGQASYLHPTLPSIAALAARLRRGRSHLLRRRALRGRGDGAQHHRGDRRRHDHVPVRLPARPVRVPEVARHRARVEGARQRDADASCSPATPSATCACS